MSTIGLLPAEPELVDLAWFIAAMLIGAMGIYMAAANRIDKSNCPDIIPLFYAAISGLLLVNVNKSRWFQEDMVDVVVELLLIAVIVAGAASVCRSQLRAYGMRMPREAFDDVRGYCREILKEYRSRGD